MKSYDERARRVACASIAEVDPRSDPRVLGAVDPVRGHQPPPPLPPNPPPPEKPPNDPEPPDQLEPHDDPPEPPKLTTIVLHDEETGKPIPNQRFVMVMPDGSELTGTLDEEGKAEIEADASGDIIFPDVHNPRPA